LNNQTKSVIELREVSISRSKPSVSLLQWHCQCNDLSSHRSIHQWIWSYIHVQLVSLLQWHLSSMQWSIYSHRPTHQWTWSYVHVQLVSLLQWRAQSRSLQWASWSVSLLQWHCQCDDLSSHRSTHQWTWSYIHVQLVSLLQWHLSSMRWSIYSHRSIYQWIDLSTRSRATSEPASMTLLPRIVSLLQ